jgi:hypothetical protein
MQGQGLERGEVIVSESLISQFNYIGALITISVRLYSPDPVQLAK